MYGAKIDSPAIAPAKKTLPSSAQNEFSEVDSPRRRRWRKVAIARTEATTIANSMPLSDLSPPGSGNRVAERPSDSRPSLPPPLRIARTIRVEFAAMRICLTSDDVDGGAPDQAAGLADLLATRHEVTLIRPAGADPARVTGAAVREILAEPSEELGSMLFANEQHLHSAATLAAIDMAYGDQGPDYLEGPDRGAPALMALMARRGGHRSLRDTSFGIRLVGGIEMTALHDAELGADGVETFGDLEREQLRLADRVIWPGGDGADLYRRYYGGESRRRCGSRSA